jgi:hypothetical protein
MCTRAKRMKGSEVLDIRLPEGTINGPVKGENGH